jgi:hypothetical protein
MTSHKFILFLTLPPPFVLLFITKAFYSCHKILGNPSPLKPWRRLWTTFSRWRPHETLLWCYFCAKEWLSTNLVLGQYWKHNANKSLNTFKLAYTGIHKKWSLLSGGCCSIQIYNTDILINTLHKNLRTQRAP